VTIADLRKVDQERWPTTLVRDVMRPLEGLAAVSPDDTLVVALERFGADDLPTLPVVRERQLVGLLDREAILGYLRMRETLGIR
jgi:CBS domain-containing protein